MDIRPDHREQCSNSDSLSSFIDSAIVLVENSSSLIESNNIFQKFPSSSIYSTNLIPFSISKQFNKITPNDSEFKNKMMDSLSNSLSTSTLSIPSVSDVTESSPTPPSVLFSMMQSMPFLMLGQHLASAIGSSNSTFPQQNSSQNLNNSSNQTDFSIDSILSTDNSRLYRSQTEYSSSNQLSLNPQSILLTKWIQSQQRQRNLQDQNQQYFKSSQNSLFSTNFDSQFTIPTTYPHYNNIAFESGNFNLVSYPWIINQEFQNNSSSNLNEIKNENCLKISSDSILKPTSSSPNILTSSSSSSSIKRKPQNRGPRIPFTTYQVTELENKFNSAQYLSSLEVNQLAKRLNLTDNRIRIWFQNRRAREKREHRTTNIHPECGTTPPPPTTRLSPNKIITISSSNITKSLDDRVCDNSTNISHQSYNHSG